VAVTVLQHGPGPAANMTGCELAVGCTAVGPPCWMTTVGVCCFFLTDHSILPRHTISPCCNIRGSLFLPGVWLLRHCRHGKNLSWQRRHHV